MLALVVTVIGRPSSRPPAQPSRTSSSDVGFEARVRASRKEGAVASPRGDMRGKITGPIIRTLFDG